MRVIWLRWPHFGRTLNVAHQCVLMNSIPPGQRAYEPVDETAVSLYGSDAHARPGTRYAILKAVHKRLDRLSLWQWAVLNAFTSLLAIAIVAVIIQLTHHHTWGGIRWWVEYGVSYAIFFATWSTLFRYLRMRRRQKRGSAALGR